jgi:predicted phosphodiesterase
MIINPAIGYPKYVVKTPSPTLSFIVKTGTIQWAKISKPGYSYTATSSQMTIISTSDGLGQPIKKCSFNIPSSTPDGLYDFYVEITGTPTSWAPHSIIVINSFKTTSFKFIQISDIHIGKDGGDNTNVGDLWALANRINIENPDFVIITGDCTDAGYLAEIKYFKACIYKFNVPVFITIGNHDWLNSGLSYYRSYITPQSDYGCSPWYNEYYFTYGNFAFIQFDSGQMETQIWPWPYPQKRLIGLTNIQFNWIKERYSALGNKKTFIFTHGPFVGHSESHTHTQNDLPFVNWVNTVNVEAIFSGHTHDHNIFYSVNQYNMDAPPFYGNPIAQNTMMYIYDPPYFELASSTLRYP